MSGCGRCDKLRVAPTRIEVWAIAKIVSEIPAETGPPSSQVALEGLRQRAPQPFRLSLSDHAFQEGADHFPLTNLAIDALLDLPSLLGLHELPDVVADTRRDEVFALLDEELGDVCGHRL